MDNVVHTARTRVLLSGSRRGCPPILACLDGTADGIIEGRRALQAIDHLLDIQIRPLVLNIRGPIGVPSLGARGERSPPGNTRIAVGRDRPRIFRAGNPKFVIEAAAVRADDIGAIALKRRLLLHIQRGRSIDRRRLGDFDHDSSKGRVL